MQQWFSSIWIIIFGQRLKHHLFLVNSHNRFLDFFLPEFLSSIPPSFRGEHPMFYHVFLVKIPKSSILIGCSIIKHPFWDTSNFQISPDGSHISSFSHGLPMFFVGFSLLNASFSLLNSPGMWQRSLRLRRRSVAAVSLGDATDIAGDITGDIDTIYSQLYKYGDIP